MAQQHNDTVVLVGLAASIVGFLGVLVPSLLEPNLVASIGAVASLILIAVGHHRDRDALIGVGILGVLLTGFYMWAPMWHTVFYGAIYKAPGALQWLVVGALIALGGMALGGYRKANGAADTGKLPVALFFGGAVIAVVGFLFIGWFVGGIYAQEDMADRVNSSVEETDHLSETTVGQHRALPEAVASNYARNSLQTPRYELEGGDITVINGTPHWSYSLAPDGGYNSWRIQQDGAVYVRMNTQDKDVDVERGEFTTGQGMVLFDNYEWQLKRNDYNHEYKEPFIVPHDDELYMAVPYVDYNHEVRFTPLPQVYSVPEFGGVKVIDQDGNIEDLSPQEAQEDPRLEGQNFYPYDLAEYRVNSMQYQHGALNKWFTHEDQLELADVPGQGNGQPFTVMTEEGMRYFVAAEPYGEDTHGVYQVWEIDARTGEMSRLTYSPDNTLLGPAKATRFVRQEHPNFDWVSSGEDGNGNVEVSEPLPLVANGSLYWQTFVVPTDSAGVSQVSFVNAETGTVTSVQTDGEIRAFLEGTVDDGGTDSGSDDGSGESNDSDESGQDDAESTGELIITVEYPDGTTETITVPEGATVSVDHEEE